MQSADTRVRKRLSAFETSTSIQAHSVHSRLDAEFAKKKASRQSSMFRDLTASQGSESPGHERLERDQAADWKLPVALPDSKLNASAREMIELSASGRRPTGHQPTVRRGQRTGNRTAVVPGHAPG
jgi:hypothetical protein